MKRALFLLLAALAVDPNKIAPDIEERLAKFQRVEMPFTFEGLSAHEKTEVCELIAASQDLEDIYWRQNNPDDITLYNSLATATDPKLVALRRYLWINGSRFDQIEENRPFYGTEPDPPGRHLIAPGLTRDDIEAYVKAHPKEKDAIYAERTIIEVAGRNPLRLRAVPYHVRYRTFLEHAATHLRNAAAASEDKAFAKFLRDRATALLNDNYYPSDLEWVALKDPKIDIIHAICSTNISTATSAPVSARPIKPVGQVSSPN